MRDGGSVASTSRSRGAMSGSMADDESEMTEIYDQGKTNLVYLESSKVKADKKMQKLQVRRFRRFRRVIEEGVVELGGITLYSYSW